MPRAAIIAWDHETGQLRLIASCALDPPDAKGLEVERLPRVNPNLIRVAAWLKRDSSVMIPATPEGMAKLARFLQSISPVPFKEFYKPQEVLPEPTTEDWARAQKYTSPGTAKGVKRHKKFIGREQVQDMIDNLPDLEEFADDK